jgi:hypothetical protein
MANNEAFNLQKFIISIVIIGIVLVVGIYITSEIEGVTKVENTAGSVTNETVTFGDVNAAQTLNVATLEDVSCSAVTFVANATATGATLAVGNVTLTSDCTLLNASAINVDPAASTVFVSYTFTYTASTDASNSADDVVNALATGTSWISILVVVGFAVIVLTMLTSGLGATANRREEIPYY